ncbi:MAG: DNA gyrase inhibitor YacG [Nitrospirae bacterium]|nr:DNA gyrase inhibitor YacG [Nitrospirota bacterium]
MKVKCPTCRKRTEWQDNLYRPFCSERCKLTDLGAWASEEYRIEGKLADEGGQTPLEKENENG